MTASPGRALIVGGAGGLGAGTVAEHVRRGWMVTSTVRQMPVDAPPGGGVQLKVLDTTDWSSVDALPGDLKGPFDRLFVIAGDAGPEGSIGEVDPEAFARLLLLNTLAPLRIIDRWESIIAPKGTIAVMSSSQASLALNDDGTKESYRISKAGLNMGFKSLAIRRADKRTYIAVNPGWVRTAMGGEAADMSIEESVPQVVDTLDRLSGSGGMHYVNYDGAVLPW